jgi:hypothetical protein
MEMHNTDPFSTSFDYASGKTGERFQNPLWQITEFFFGGKFKRSVATVKEFGSVIIANAIEARENKATSTADSQGPLDEVDAISGSLINSLLDSIQDRQVVADAALNYLSAGM